MVRRFWLLLLPLPLVSLLAVPLPAAADRGTVVARYGFDAGSGRVAESTDDSGNGHTLYAAGTGRVAAVAHDGGRAVRFPSGCCAVLEAASGPALNPGRAAFRFGATVRLTRAQTSPGSNVVQKGYASGPGGEWKLQVDGYAGQPSCVLVGAGSPAIHLALAGRSVADGRWHQLTCLRAGGELSISVDGTVAATTAIPADLAVDNGLPVRIGGKGAGRGNDQFHGEVDDVFIAIG